MRRILIALTTLLLFYAASLAQDAMDKTYPVDANLGFSTGPAVGEKVPEFSLPDHADTLRTLKDLLGPQGAVLDFFRSADW